MVARLRTSPITLLQAAKKQIATEETWCQGASALDASGGGVWPESPQAVRWCAESAYLISLDDWTDDAQYAARNALYAAARTLFHALPSTVNDELGFAAVHKMYRRAIRLLREKKSGATT